MVDGRIRSMEDPDIVHKAVQRQIQVMKLRDAKLVVHVHTTLGLIVPPSIVQFAVLAHILVNTVADPLLLIPVIARRVESVDADLGNKIDVKG